jgi:hypothetical protein
VSKTTWGGYRPGSGRRPKGEVSGVSHHTRAALSPRHPVLVTLSTKPELGNLRSRRVHEVIRASLLESSDTGWFRVCHYSVQKHGLRFIVEAADRDALSRGMQGLNVRLAKALNRLWSRSGSVFRDRYDTKILDTGHKVRDSLRLVLNGALASPTQARNLAGRLDPYSSAAYFEGWNDRSIEPPPGPRPVARPRTALLQRGWRKHGLIGIDEAPRE